MLTHQHIGSVDIDQYDEAGMDQAGGTRRRVRSRAVSAIPLKRRQYLWDQRLPLGEITLWAGHAGIGKSQGAVWLAARVTRGELPGELHDTPSPVLYLGTEDAWSYTLAPRFVAAGADLDLVRKLYAETDEGHETTVSLVVDLDELREEIAETGARLVVLDALLSTMTSSELTKQGVVRRGLEPLARLAQELNIAVVGVVHFRKAGDANPLHMISGSAEFGQVVRSAIGFAADREAEDGSCVLSLIKTNIAPSGLPSIRYRVEPAVVDTPEGPTDVGRFVILGETDQNVGDLLNQDTGSVEERSERNEAAEWLVSYLADNGGSAKAADVFKAAKADGIAEATLKRARKRAGVTSERQGFGQGSMWFLNPSGSRLAQSDQRT
ncbi:AAA family ATPase [Saccharopolyspora taberi]|uniref:AAA family ATPase n=1 Tax=Saccharopolyspora taberi TaxID=60895 RepID=A0ABN3VCD2_9PSEU